MVAGFLEAQGETIAVGYELPADQPAVKSVAGPVFQVPPHALFEVVLGQQGRIFRGQQEGTRAHKQKHP